MARLLLTFWIGEGLVSGSNEFGVGWLSAKMVSRVSGENEASRGMKILILSFTGSVDR